MRFWTVIVDQLKALSCVKVLLSIEKTHKLLIGTYITFQYYSKVDSGTESFFAIINISMIIKCETIKLLI